MPAGKAGAADADVARKRPPESDLLAACGYDYRAASDGEGTADLRACGQSQAAGLQCGAAVRKAEDFENIAPAGLG